MTIRGKKNSDPAYICVRFRVRHDGGSKVAVRRTVLGEEVDGRELDNGREHKEETESHVHVQSCAVGHTG